MSDYISREEAEIAMCYACEYDCEPHKRALRQSRITANDCYHLRGLYDIPAADVAEVRHGHWIDEYNECRCPYCGEAWDYCDNDTERFVYCPKCGAKLDEEAEE